MSDVFRISIFEFRIYAIFSLAEKRKDVNGYGYTSALDCKEEGGALKTEKRNDWSVRVHGQWPIRDEWPTWYRFLQLQ